MEWPNSEQIKTKINEFGDSTILTNTSPLVVILLHIRGVILPLVVELGMCLSWIIGNLKFSNNCKKCQKTIFC